MAVRYEIRRESMKARNFLSRVILEESILSIFAVPTLEEGQDKDCVTYEQFAESIKKNMALTNETDSLQVLLIIPNMEIFVT